MSALDELRRIADRGRQPDHVRALHLLGLTDGQRLSYGERLPGQAFRGSRVPVARLLGRDALDQDRDVWFGLVPIPDGPGRGTAAEALAVPAIWADIDVSTPGVKDGGMPSWDAAWAVVADLSTAIGSLPAFVVLSGHGLQPVWPVAPEDRSDVPRWAALARRFGELVGATARKHGGEADSVFDLARVLRAPGTVNHKNAAEPVAVRVEWSDEWQHLSADALEAALPPPSPTPDPEGGQPVPARSAGSGSAAEGWLARAIDARAADLAGTANGRHNRLRDSACLLGARVAAFDVDASYWRAEAQAALLDACARNGLGAEEDTARTFSDGWDYGFLRPAAPPGWRGGAPSEPSTKSLVDPIGRGTYPADRDMSASLRQAFASYRSEGTLPSLFSLLREARGACLSIEQAASMARQGHRLGDLATARGSTPDDLIRLGWEAAPEPAPAEAMEWPEVLPLLDGCAEPFPLDVLPAGMAAAVAEVSAAVIVDPAIPATAFLGVAAFLVGTDVVVDVLPSWSVRCNLYTCAVAETGSAKSPAVAPAKGPLDDWERAAIEAHRQDRAAAQVRVADLEASKKKVPADFMELDALRAVLRREVCIAVDDVTPERLAELMAMNGERMLALNDEGALLQHIAGLYAPNPNIDVYLKSWDGGRLDVDRKGSAGKAGTRLTLQNPRLTLSALVQPATLGRIVADARLRDRGAIGRLLIAWPPSTVGTRFLSQMRRTDYAEVRAWNAHVSRQAGQTRRLRLAPEAFALFTAGHDRWEADLGRGRDLDDVRDTVAKLRESVVRLAGLFAALDGLAEVDEDTMRRALALGHYYLQHARVVAQAGDGSARGSALRVLSAIEAGKLGERFTVREARRICHLQGDVRSAFDLLDVHGYVRPEDDKLGYGTFGRSVGARSPVILVNPQARMGGARGGGSVAHGGTGGTGVGRSEKNTGTDQTSVSPGVSRLSSGRGV